MQTSNDWPAGWARCCASVSGGSRPRGRRPGGASAIHQSWRAINSGSIAMATGPPRRRRLWSSRSRRHRPRRMVRPGERIHVIGIAGSGAAGVALLAHHAGARVDGCDLDAPSPYTAPLEAAGVPFVRGHDPAHLVGVDRIAITPALRAVPDLAELQAAQAAGLPVITWQG